MPAKQYGFNVPDACTVRLDIMLDRVKERIRDVIGSTPIEESIEGSVKRIREDATDRYQAGQHGKQLSHRYVATIKGGEDLYVPPDVGEELMDAYRNGEDINVTGAKTTVGRMSPATILEGEIYVDEEPVWRVVNKDRTTYGPNPIIYAEPL